jgi:SAM-dependent methyltransferase
VARRSRRRPGRHPEVTGSAKFPVYDEMQKTDSVVNSVVSALTPSIDEVRTFWEAHPCGEETSTAKESLEYFLGIEHYRYTNAPFIAKVAGFNRFAGRRVLEIGCGLGTDGVQFAKAGADYVGVDLTEAAVELARQNFSARGLRGEFLTVNAEQLPFPADSFDHVYSFGVIHHTPNPGAVLDEIWRVVRPEGTVTVTVYNRTSINYYVEIMFLRRLGRALLRPAWASVLIAKTLGLPREKLDGHRENLLKIPRPTHEQWVSMNTDGPACPLARVYSAAEAGALFERFGDVRMEVHFFDTSHWPLIGRLLSEGAANAIGTRFGWYRSIYAQKQLA